jgi:hypothetical protein
MCRWVRSKSFKNEVAMIHVGPQRYGKILIPTISQCPESFYLTLTLKTNRIKKKEINDLLLYRLQLSKLSF